MNSGATRRIRGGGGGVAGGRGPRAKAAAGPGFMERHRLGALVLVSSVLHAAVLGAYGYLPGLFPAEKKQIRFYTITVAPLPGPAGGGGTSTEAVKPPPAPPEERPPEPPDKDEVRLAKKTAERPKPEAKKAPEAPKKPEPGETGARPKPAPEAPAGPGQGPAGGGARAGAVTGPVAIEGGADFPFSFYIDTLQKKIGGRWRPPDLSARAMPRVVIFFRIERGGRIKDVAVEESSGIGYVDRSALSAVMESSPLPPLPEGYEGERLGVHYTFVVGEKK